MKLLVKSSSSEPYEVQFSIEGNCVLIFCPCQAGLQMQMCKHRLALINGDTTVLKDPSDGQLLLAIRGWPQFPLLQKRAEKYLKELGALERQQDALADARKAIKDQMAKDLRFGNYEERAV